MTGRFKADRLLLASAYLGFISLGLPDTLIGVAWPSVRETFQLDHADISWIFFGTGAGYFLSSFFTGRFLSLFKIGSVLAVSTALVGLSGFGYGLAPVWVVFAICAILHGLGSGAIDAGLNHYVAHHFTARHMNWLHACYGLGAMTGPLIMTGAVAWHNSWRMGYVIVAGILACLALFFWATRRRWEARSEPGASVDLPPVRRITVGEALGHRLVWVQALFFFVYTGMEVTVGQWSFTILTESRQLPEHLAGFLVTLYWGSILAGRILFGFIGDRIGLDRLLRWSTFFSLAGTALLAAGTSGVISALALALTGLGLAAIYPCMMMRTPKRLGPEIAAHAIGFQTSAAMLGAAALPSLAGLLSQHFGLEVILLSGVSMALLLILLHESILLMTRLSRVKT